MSISLVLRAYAKRNICQSYTCKQICLIMLGSAHNFCITKVKCWYPSCPAKYISLLTELKYAFQSACFILCSHSGIILHPSALLAIKYKAITNSSRTEWIAKYMLTLVIWHCCSFQTRPLLSVCNRSCVPALLWAPPELTFWNCVYNGQCCTLILRTFWGNNALIGCQCKLTFCFVSCPSSGRCGHIQQLLAHTRRYFWRRWA